MKKQLIPRLLLLLAVPAFCVWILSGCAWMAAGAAQNLAEQIYGAILDSNDLKTVEDGAPAHLLIIDGLIRNSPHDAKLLLTGSSLYSAYSDVFVKDSARAARLTEKALGYALRALCAEHPSDCRIRKAAFEDFQQRIASKERSDVPLLFTLGSAWASWISANRSDWNAVAEISRVETLMRRVVELDETHRDGAAHMYLGTLASLVPPALGGRPEAAQTSFERAIEISQGKNLMMKVAYARQYARMMFDRELHDRLLNDVIRAETEQPGYTLINTLAKQQAQELLETADDYF